MFPTLLVALAIIVVVNCVYYLLFTRFTFQKSPVGTTNTSLPVSVIVCAKNEAENLRNHIPHWLAQNYTDFELILVNDASIDNTLDVIEEFAEKDSRIKIVNVVNNEAFWANKKYALTLGIKKAKNNHFLFTDADCIPTSENWIQEMANSFSNQKQLVLGYGGYQKIPSLLNKLIRFETFMTAVQYFSYAKMGIPYMGVGRNLAYTSKLFYDNNGFMSHMHIRSGDDDLFVNEAATKENTAICFSPDSITESIPKKTWGSWLNQKKRHITTASNYKPSHKFLLTLFFISNLLFWAGAIAAFVFLPWEMVLTLVLLRFLLVYISLGKAFSKLKEPGLIYFIPFLEFLLICFQLIIFISNIFSKPKHWK